MKRACRAGKQMLKNAAKRTMKAALKMVIKALAPLFITFIPVIIIIVAALILIAAVYGSMPQEQSLTGVKPSKQDLIIKSDTEKVVAENNVRETWLIGENISRPLGYLADRYGSDVKIANKWGDSYAPALYKAMQNRNENKMADSAWIHSEIERLAYDLRPFFYYKESTVTVCGEDGCESYIVYLLVEAKTIRGQYRYTYEWVTETSDGGSVTYEQLRDTILVGYKWEHLEKYLKEYLGLESKKDIALSREMVFNAGEGFTNKREWLNWLDAAFAGLGGATAWASGAMVPADLKPYFDEASQRFDIPSWFLAAVAMKESTFNTTIYGADGAGSYGIMQVLPENWNKYAPLLGFDPAADRDNPRAQIMVGAYMLAAYGIKVDWDGPNWKEESLPMLVAYNAGAGNLKNSSMVEYVRKNYAETVWAYAEKFRAPVTWPAPGYTEISSAFGMRIHPVTGVKDKMHNGIDIAAPAGAAAVSVSGGIAYVDYDEDGYGNYVVVKDATYEYYYAHLSSVSVVNGQQITAGMELGKVGSTGLCTGPHLHFGVKLLDTGQWIDPLLILK